MSGTVENERERKLLAARKRVEELRKKKKQEKLSGQGQHSDEPGTPEHNWATQLELVNKKHLATVQNLREEHSALQAQLQTEIHTLTQALADQQSAQSALENEREKNIQQQLNVQTAIGHREKDTDVQRHATSAFDTDVQNEGRCKGAAECEKCNPELLRLQKLVEKSQLETETYVAKQVQDTKHIQSLETAKTDIEEQHKAIMETVRAEKEKAEEVQKALQEQFEVLKANSLSEEQARKDLEIQLQEAREKIQSDGLSMEVHQQQLRGLEAQQSKEAEQLAKATMEMEEQIKNLHEKLSSEQRANAEQKKDLDDVSKKIKELEDAIEKEKSALAVAVSERASLQSELTRIKDEPGVTNWQEKIKALEIEKNEAWQEKRQHDETKRLLDNSKQTSEDLRKEIKQLSNQLDSANDQIQKLMQDLEQRRENVTKDEYSEEDSGLLKEINQLKEENAELQTRLERQFAAFTTIRGELTTVRDREQEVERKLTRENDDLKFRILKKTDAYEILDKEHEAAKKLQEKTELALNRAQMKLHDRGYSPVSENLGSDDGSNEYSDEYEYEPEEEPRVSYEPITPDVGRRPPLEKPEFREFLETPRCSGCLSQVIEI